MESENWNEKIQFFDVFDDFGSFKHFKTGFLQVWYLDVSTYELEFKLWLFCLNNLSPFGNISN